MKTKNFDKKLLLNKNTVADLGNDEMNVVYGGETNVRTICVTNCATVCPLCMGTIKTCPV